MKRFIFSCLFLFLPGYLYAANKTIKTKTIRQTCEKAFLIDRYGSMRAGASLAISAEAFLGEVAANYLLPSKNEQSFWLGFCAGILNYYFTVQLMSLYYEVFGYGFRVRSLGGTVQKYKWRRFGLGFEAIYSNFYPPAAYDVPLLIDIAGYEASQVLMEEIIFSSLRNKPLNVNVNWIYLLSYISKIGFILNGGSIKFGIGGGDIRSFFSKEDYLAHINAKHEGTNFSKEDYLAHIINAKHEETTDKIKLSDLRVPGLIFIPDILIAIMAYLQDKGMQSGISFFQWKDIAYRPFLTAQFTPFGVGYSIHNYLRHQDRIFLLSFNLGKSPFYTSYYGGIGGKTDGLYTFKNYTLDLAAHLWYQPKLLLQATDVLEDKNYWGGLVGIYNKFKINPHFSLYGAILYKTAGYLEGMIAQKGLIWQAGVTVSYNIDVEHFYDV